LIAVVVLPLPPLWFTTAITLLIDRYLFRDVGSSIEADGTSILAPCPENPDPLGKMLNQ